MPRENVLQMKKEQAQNCCCSYKTNYNHEVEMLITANEPTQHFEHVSESKLMKLPL